MGYSEPGTLNVSLLSNAQHWSGITKYQKCPNKSRPVWLWNNRAQAFFFASWQQIIAMPSTATAWHRPCLCSGRSSRTREIGHGRASHIPAEGSILGLLHHQPQRKGDHLQFLGAHLWNKKKMDRPCPLTPINAENLPWILVNFKSRCVALSLVSLSFKPLEGVYIFLSPQMEVLHKCGPTAGNYTAWYKGTLYQT